MRCIPVGLSLLLLFSTKHLPGQDLTSYFRLVEAGELNQVRRDLPRLLEQYPNHPGVAFLDAVTKERAEEAVIAYKKLIQNYPDSPYVDDAMIKVGEYFYARGLYTQASRELARFSQAFPKSEHLQRAIDLRISSLLAIGENDSASYYVGLYGRQFPFLDLNYDFNPGKPLVVRPLSATPTPETEGMKQPSVTSLSTGPTPPRTPVNRKEPEPAREPTEEVVEQIPKPFVIQVGAYGSVKNAMRQKMLLEQRGYEVELSPITSRGKKLHAVQIVRFASKSEAETIGKKLKSDFGYSYLVLERPE